MSLPSDSPTPGRATSNARWLILAVVVSLVCSGGWYASWYIRARETTAPQAPEDNRRRIAVPELDGGVAWLNTAGPLRMKDLRGKIVLLDFWTLCCINCMHVLPDLAKLEKKYPNELVVIGVHSAKFENEKNTESIRKAILRYEVSHPVVNDANMRIWRHLRFALVADAVSDRSGGQRRLGRLRRGALSSRSTARSPSSSRSTRTRRRSTRSR